MPGEPEAQGLLALLVLLHARSAARVSADGSLVRLAEQDRRLWDRDLIAEGQAIVRACVQRGRPGPYQIQAAINAVHSAAPSFDGTDWHAILTLYNQLYTLTPTPVVALNRAVALAEVRGPAAGLAAVDGLRSSGLDSYYLFHAARADLLRRLRRDGEAAARTPLPVLSPPTRPNRPSSTHSAQAAPAASGPGTPNRAQVETPRGCLGPGPGTGAASARRPLPVTKASP
jgi:RNA polymerase sigma-70 factor, ECF subfamily